MIIRRLKYWPSCKSPILLHWRTFLELQRNSNFNLFLSVTWDFRKGGPPGRCALKAQGHVCLSDEQPCYKPYFPAMLCQQKRTASGLGPPGTQFLASPLTVQQRYLLPILLTPNMLKVSWSSKKDTVSVDSINVLPASLNPARQAAP